MIIIGRKWERYKNIHMKEIIGTWCATTNFEGLAWFATGLAPPTEYKTEAEAQKVIDASRKKWPEAKFKMFDTQETSVDANHGYAIDKEKPDAKMVS